MLKIMLAGAAALAIAGSTFVYAQQRPTDPEPSAREQFKYQPLSRMSAEDAQALADARIAGLRAGLRLTPEQEKSWPAIEAAMRELSADRIARRDERRKEREARGDQPPRERDMLAMLRQRAEIMNKRAAGLARLADAAEPLYNSLDDGQKRRLAMLTRGMRAGGGHHHWRGHGEGRGERGR